MLKRLYAVSEITLTLETRNFGEGVIDIPISPEDEITTHLKELIDHPGANQIEILQMEKLNLFQ